MSSFAALATAAACQTTGNVARAASELVEIPALQGKGYGKPATIYPDYTLTNTGLQYKDLRIGSGPTVAVGDKILIDWDAYTIGYYGRIVQAKNLAKGGSFEGNDEGFLRFTVGSANEVIPGLQEGVQGMTVGGIRRIIVPPGPLSYPSDTGFKNIGPKPSSFSGKRTLDFVMCNQGAIDKTLLFDIEILGVGDRARALRAEGTWLVTPSAK
ncbi:Peptidyl-prolyl cis-trans isomerase fkbp19, chloroplastic [Cymbomonas tetramitiformis]|uniref:peptidylprolyl isomerase n=1 Tax=Cymbomonas tetramitiformis TaxID=36881 RepID=A0AAE0H0A9_9CHLO|nr:Peptidyl-prolyl cis-trans isomerase fkbp19, chloroplastic [Cymbomonas tetramitiformis]